MRLVGLLFLFMVVSTAVFGQQPAPANVKVLSREESASLALAQASSYQQARINELIAAEDVRQAKAAFLPQLNAASSFIYTSPSSARPLPGEPRVQSLIANNAIREYLSGVTAAGEIDLSGRLRATLKRNAALLEAAHAGTEIARRTLLQAVDEAYYGLSLANARRTTAELNLVAAEAFENNASLLLQAGEVAEVDFTRARLQTLVRRDELEQAQVAQAIAADSLRVFIGYDFSAPLAVTELSALLPVAGELDRFTESQLASRPEFAQLAAEKSAAEAEKKAARAARHPQINYSIFGGWDTDSLKPAPLRAHSGASATVGITIPLFDGGASRSREQQADLRAQSIESQRALAVREFAQQFQAARAQAQSAASRIQLLQAGLVDAQKNVAASVARYRGGEAQIIEVTDAQNSLFAERAALNQAIFDYQIAKARLAQLTGQ